MASYQRGRDYEDRGPSRYRDEDDTGRRRDEHGRFMSDEDRGRERSYRGTPERDEQGRFMSDEDRGRSAAIGDAGARRRGRTTSDRERGYSDRDRDYRSSSHGRSPYEDEGILRLRADSRTPERDEHGRFMSDDEARGGGYSRGRDYEGRDNERDYENERRSSRTPIMAAGSEIPKATRQLRVGAGMSARANAAPIAKGRTERRRTALRAARRERTTTTSGTGTAAGLAIGRGIPRRRAAAGSIGGKDRTIGLDPI